MDTKDYQLLPRGSRSAEPQSLKTSLWQKVTAATVATLLLILAAAYGPQLLDSSPAIATSSMVPATGGVSAAAPLPLQNSGASLFADQETLADLYESVSPSVVNIQVVAEVDRSGIFPFSSPESETPRQQGQGSGFIYDNEGHIVTNNHVVEDSIEITVVFHNGYWADAAVVATDPQADLAVLKVTPPEGFDWRPLPLASPEDVRVGHMVIAIGNPFGLAGTMTRGIVSAVGRGMPVGDDMANVRYTLPDVIQTDAAINPGNSGGPLLDLNGRVVGVNFAINSPVRSNSGVGFAIPVSIVQRVVPELIKDGAFEYAYLGLSGTSITPDVARQLDIPGNRLGVYVSGVVEGGPSAAAGIIGGNRTVQTSTGNFSVGGDIVVAIDDMAVRSFDDLVSFLVTRAEVDQTVTLTVIRDGIEQAIDVVLGERPGQARLIRTSERSSDINARAAISIAVEHATEEGLLDGEIIEKVSAPGTVGGEEVWVVELSDDSETITVLVRKSDGEILEP